MERVLPHHAGRILTDFFRPAALKVLDSQTVRVAAAMVVLCSMGRAQFKSTVPLVLAPTTVTDSKGHYIDGLTTADLILYDNNVPQKIQMDWMAYPIDLVVAVETNANSGPVIDKLGGSGILFSQLLAAYAGRTAVITFSDEVRLHQDFTGEPDLVIHSLRMLRKEGDGARMLDALLQASAMLERLNAAVYWATYSPFLEPFTEKRKTAEDLKPEAERIKTRQCALCPGPDNSAVPYDAGPGSPIYALGELMRLSRPDLATLFTRVTGGRSVNFLKKDGLETAIQLVGEEVHRQYILSFQPASEGGAGLSHSIRVEVKDHPELQAKTRAGYWALQ